MMNYNELTALSTHDLLNVVDRSDPQVKALAERLELSVVSESPTQDFSDEGLMTSVVV